MKIAFDAKRAFNNNTGLGNYSRWVISEMENNYPENEYLLYTPSIKNNFKTELDIIKPEGVYSYMKSIWRTYGIKNIKPDNFDLYHGLTNELPIGLKNCKKVVTIHDLIFLRYPQYYKLLDRLIYKKKFEYAAKNADKIIAISIQTKADLINYFNINENKIEVIYINCNERFYEKQSELSIKNIIEKYKLPSCKFHLYVSTFEERKNHLFLLKAFNLNKLNSDYNLILIGRYGNTLNEVKKFINENNLNNRVHIINNCDFKELLTFYQLASTFIYVPIFEGFGIPIIEAMASQLPVLCPNTFLFNDITKQATMFFENENLESLREKMIEIESFEAQNNLINRQNIRIKDFDNKILLAEYQTVYEKLF